VVAAVTVFFELWASVSHAPTVARVAYDHLRDPAVSVRDADIDPLAYFVPTSALVAAAREIPRNATYTVLLGGEQSRETGPAVTVTPAAIAVFRLWLLPRRYVATTRRAQWAVLYRRRLATVQSPYNHARRLDKDVTLLQLSRP
jgi:hypothetical protein